jgi:hypothetical protein
MPQIRLTATFTIPRAPECPICREPLRSGCFRILHGLAYCPQCVNAANYGLQIATEREWPLLIQCNHVSSCDGIHFFTPQVLKSNRMAAHLIAAAIREHRYMKDPKPMGVNKPSPADWDDAPRGVEPGIA